MQCDGLTRQTVRRDLVRRRFPVEVAVPFCMFRVGFGGASGSGAGAFGITAVRIAGVRAGHGPGRSRRSPGLLISLSRMAGCICRRGLRHRGFRIRRDDPVPLAGIRAPSTCGTGFGRRESDVFMPHGEFDPRDRIDRLTAATPAPAGARKPPLEAYWRRHWVACPASLAPVRMRVPAVFPDGIPE